MTWSVFGIIGAIVCGCGFIFLFFNYNENPFRKFFTIILNPFLDIASLFSVICYFVYGDKNASAAEAGEEKVG